MKVLSLSRRILKCRVAQGPFICSRTGPFVNACSNCRSEVLPAGKKNYCGRDTQLSKLAQQVALPEIEGAGCRVGPGLTWQLTPGFDLS